MPLLEPKNDEIIRTEMLAQLIGGGVGQAPIPGAGPPLTDVAEGGRVGTTLGVVAIRHSILEARQRLLTDRLLFDAEGSDLDFVVGSVPGVKARLGPSYSGGRHLRVTRSTTSGEQIIPAGSVFGTTDNVVFVSTEDRFFMDGSSVYPAAGQDLLPVVCAVRGPAGNVGAGQVRRVLSAPSIISVTNPSRIDNGLGRESDDALKKRVHDYLGGLVGVTAPALRYLAMSFETMHRALHCSVWEDPENRGFTKVVVDDGQAFEGFTRPAMVTGGVVPLSGQRDVWFDAPMAGDEIKLYVNGALVMPVKLTTRAESGRAFIDRNFIGEVLKPGDTWEIRGHKVYTDFIARLQDLIEGDVANPGILPGWRASGARAQVAAATPQLVAYDALVVVRTGFDPADTIDQFKSVMLSVHRDNDLGEPVLIAELTQNVLNDVAGLRDVKFRNPGNTDEPAENIYASGPLAKIMTRADMIRVNGR